jgi:pSer/pThr/pTyr-binding forkhead associated (FHA) protein
LGQERDVSLTGDAVRVGRSRDSDLQLDSGFVSRFHALFERRGDGWFIVDQGSKNGVFVNGHRATGNVPVTVGDTIKVGDYSLILRESQVTPPEHEEYDEERTVLAPPRQGRIAPIAPPQTPPQRPAATAPPQAPPPAPVPEERPQPAVAVTPVTPTAVSAASAASSLPPGPLAPPPAQAPPVSTQAAEPAAQSAPPATSSAAGEAFTAREQALVAMLESARPAGCTPDQLIGAVWGAGGADEEMLRRLVARTEAKLAPSGMRIMPGPGGSFRLVPPGE